MNTPTLRVHDVAEAVGVSADTIRLYEKKGLIEPALRDRNGYRRYTVEQVEKIRRVVYPELSES